MKYLCLILPLLLLISCRGPATGPLKGVLVVYDSEEMSDDVHRILDEIQLFVSTTDVEPVFAFSYAPLDDFQGDLRERRTILFIVDDIETLPEELERTGEVYHGRDVWASRQEVLGVLAPGFTDSAELSALLEEAYDRHMIEYLYGSFVATQMSSPERIDSLLANGFSLDIPKSYFLEEWNPDVGFIQYQRRVSDDCLLLLSIRWIDDDEVLSADEAASWRQTVTRRFFFNAAADSVDRSRLSVEPMVLHGLEGWKLIGMWRNPEHLNAGAFTSYVLFDQGRRYLLDMEVFHEHREKEPYIREGWMIMNTFLGGE